MRRPNGVPDDEWLLARALAEAHRVERIGAILSVMVADYVYRAGGDWENARAGARHAMYGEDPYIARHPNWRSHAAGAALAMALESDS